MRMKIRGYMVLFLIMLIVLPLVLFVLMQQPINYQEDEEMTIYNYLNENSIQNSKYPANNHLVFETDDAIYFVDSSNAKILLKTADEGVTVSTVTTRTNKDIARAWHDRVNNIIYFVDCDYDNTTSYVWSLNTSTDSINEISSIPADIFDIWIYDGDLWYYYFGGSYELLTTYIDPDGDGGTLEWDSTDTTHYTEIDEGATPNTVDYISSETNEDQDIITFPNGLDLSAYDYYSVDPTSQIYEIVVKLYGKGGRVDVSGPAALGMDTPQSITFDSDSYSWQQTSFSGLSLEDSDIDDLEITLEHNKYNSSYDTFTEENTQAISTRPEAMCFDGTYIYAILDAYNTRVYYYNTLLQSQGYHAISGLTNPTGITWDGTYFYIVDSSTKRVYQYNSSFVEQTYFSLSASYAAIDITWDGTYFYVTQYTSGVIAYYNSSFELQGTITVSGVGATGITWDGDFLFITDLNEAEAYAVTTGGSIVATYTVSNSLYGICYDGNLFHAGNYLGEELVSYSTGYVYVATLRVGINYYGDELTDLVIKNHTDDITDSNTMGVVTGRSWDSSQIAIVDDQFWFLWKWSNENAELWHYDVGDDDFTQDEDCGSTTEIPTIQQNGITYDESNVLSFVLGTGTAEVSTITAAAPASIDDGDYITYSAISLDSENIRSETDYYIWFDKVGDESGDPAPASKTGVTVDISGAADAEDVADAIQAAVDAIDIITATNTPTTVTLTCHYNGNTTNIADVDSGMSVATTTPGVANTYYYHTYAISTDVLTKGAEYNIALMLNRNSDSTNDPPFHLEKGFHITSRYIYQISRTKGTLYKISDLSNALADGTIVAITDTYLFILRSDTTTELWKFQDMSNYILEARIFHAERDYPTMELTYRSDKLYLEEDMFIQAVGLIRINGSTSTDIRFEGYVIAPTDEDDEATLIKTVDLVNPSIYDLLKSYTGLLDEGGGDDWLDVLVTSFNYITKGTFDAATLTLPTLRRDSEKPNVTFIDQLAAGESFTWRVQPKGILDWTAGDDDSGLNYDQDTPIWDVEVTKKRVRPNYIIVKGGYFGGKQITSEDDHGVDLASQQANGIIEQEFTISWISTVTLANSYADALITTIGATFTEVRFKVKDATNGFIPSAEEITLEYTPKSITSAQYKINSVEFDDKTGITEYVVSSIVRWDVEDLSGGQGELSDQVTQVFDRTMVKTGWDSGLSYSDVTIAFTDGSRTFTLTPVVDELSYWINGKKYTIDSAQTVTITDTEGVWYIYFDGDTLTASQTTWEIADGDKAFVTIVHWNATANAAQYLAWEFHSYEMSPIDHDREHHTSGLRYKRDGGFVLSEASEQVSLTDGTGYDEDIEIAVTDGASGLFVQDIRTPGNFPVWYRSGASAWRKYTATDYAFYDNATADNVHYNSYSDPNWSSTAAASTAKYICYYLCLTNDIAEPIISVMGQTEHSTLNSARNETFDDMDMTGSPWDNSEFKLLYKMIYQSNSTYEESEDLRSVQTPGATYTPTSNPISNEAFGATWSGVETIGASKDALYDKITTGIKRVFSLGLNGGNGATEGSYFITLDAVGEEAGGGFYIDDNIDDSQDIDISMTWYRSDANNDTIAFKLYVRAMKTDGSEASSFNVENGTAIALDACASTRFEKYTYTLAAANYDEGDVITIIFSHNEAGRTILVSSIDVKYTSK